MFVQDEAVPEGEVVELLDRLDSQRRVIVAQADVLEGLGFDLYEVVTASVDEDRRRSWVLLVLCGVAFMVVSMVAHPGMFLDHWLHVTVRAIGA